MIKGGFLCFSTILMIIPMPSTTTFILEQTPRKFSFGQGLSLECATQRGEQDLTSVTWIRITKKLGCSWSKVAELRDFDSCVSVDQAAAGGDDVSATGHLGNADDTYLKLFWPSGNLNILGSYRCELVGHTKDGGISVVSTTSLSLTGDVADDYCQARDGAISAELSFLRSKVEELSTLVRSIYERQTSLLQNSDSEKTSLPREDTSSVSPEGKSKDTHSKDTLFEVTQRDELTNFSFKNLKWNIPEAGAVERFPDESSQKVESITIKTSDIIVTPGPPLVVSGQWPGGSYGLLMPEAGCPENKSDVFWWESLSRLHVESDTELPLLSGAAHVAKPLYETLESNRFVLFRLCLARGQIGDDNVWPKGSYCISRVGSLCPEGGFTSGYIQMDNENNQTEPVRAEAQAGVEFMEGVSRLHFCCRQDADHSTPIKLPAEHPFHLYRYGGDCQSVADMKFTQETLIFDTEDEANADSYENSFHPDGQLNDVNIHLCYYEQDNK